MVFNIKVYFRRIFLNKKNIKSVIEEALGLKINEGDIPL